MTESCARRSSPPSAPGPVEQLLGVRPALLDELAGRGVPVRVYVPYGDNWYRYWMRGLAESRGR